MKLFSIASPSRGARYFATQTEAKKAAREDAVSCGESFDVCEHTLHSGKDGIVALANSGSFAETKVLATIKPRKKSVDKNTNPWD
jgi:hypothetical protein